MVTNSMMHTTFFDSPRDAAWKAIKELGERLKWRMLNTQNDLREEKKHTQELESTNQQMHTTFFDSPRDAAWKAIKELGERLKWRMLNTQNDLREEKKHTQELESTNQHLREDIIELAIESCDQDRQIASRDALLANLASGMGL